MESGLSGSSLRIEFLLNENHGQISSLCVDERSDCIQNWAAVAPLDDPPASTIPFCPRSVRVLIQKNTTPLRLNPSRFRLTRFLLYYGFHGKLKWFYWR